jgi:iron complex outermembrane receptor protein
LGIDNIYSLNANIVGPATKTPGEPQKILDHQQIGFFVNDKIHLSDKTKLFLGGRLINMQETTFKLGATTPHQQRNQNYVLPQTGITYKLNSANNLYASYSKGLELGTVPIIDSFRNGDDILKPKITQQYEIGNKYSPNDRVYATIALFQAKRINEIAVNPERDAPGYPPRFLLVQDGNLINTGIEGNLGLKVNNQLDLITSLMYIQAKQTGTHSSGQAIGIPKWKSVVFADYKLSSVKGLSALGGWTYISSKNVNLDGSIKVPGYHKFDAGLKYLSKLGSSQATYRFNIENIFDTYYWRDVSQTFGTNALYPGAPRIFRATATFDF